MAHTIGIVNLKGGVGKTTTAVNLAAYLSDAGNRTLLIDCDPQGSATAMIGVPKRKPAWSLFDALDGRIRLKDAVAPAWTPMLDAIPVRPDFNRTEFEDAPEFFQKHILSDGLNEIKDGYDYIVLDTPPSVGYISINALAASDSLLIPVQCEYLAYASLVRLLKYIRHMKGTAHPGMKLLGVLLTMHDGLQPISGKIIKNIREHLKDLVFDVIIPRSIDLCESSSYGIPVLFKSPDSPGAVSYKRLADEVIGRIATSRFYGI